MKDVSGLFDDWRNDDEWWLLTSVGDSDCRSKRTLSAAADDEDKLSCEESVG